MSHRVHPKIFRIKETNDWESRGFYGKNFSSVLKEDLDIREFLQKRIGKLDVAKIEIERFPTKINIIIWTSRPGLIIGRGGKGIEELKNELEKRVLGKRGKSRIEIREIRNPWTSASLVSQWMAEQIEKRVPYRRVLKGAISRIMSQKGIEGCRVEVSGRLNGVEISRKEWLREGRLPRQTIRADIDYVQNRAYCTYGVIGIKVWIYKGERFV